MEIKVSENELNKRLDVFLCNYLNESRSLITKCIKNGKVLVNGKTVKTGYSLKTNDVINVENLKTDTSVLPEDIPLDIYYEDEYIIVVNKPSGMVVHPGNGHYSHTLVNALMGHTNKLSNVNGDNRPGIVHRIDADTSGLLLVSKTNEAHRILSDCFKAHTIKRKYIALVSGVIKNDKGKIDAPIGRSIIDRKKMCVTEKNSKKAITTFTVLERYKNATLLELVLQTGRTHQIRVHMSYIGHPVVNDEVYGNKINEYGQLLHATYLGFNHPITNEFMEFTAPLENEFVNILNTFKNS